MLWSFALALKLDLMEIWAYSSQKCGRLNYDHLDQEKVCPMRLMRGGKEDMAVREPPLLHVMDLNCWLLYYLAVLCFLGEIPRLAQSCLSTGEVAIECFMGMSFLEQDLGDKGSRVET